MPDDADGSGGAGKQTASRQGALYTDSTQGLQAVRDDYHYWTGRLTDTSFQLSLGVLAANWAVFGSVRDLLGNGWAKTSVLLVILGLGLNVIGVKWMSELHRKRINYAAEDLKRWEAECAAAFGRRDPWPFTRQIEILGRALREMKAWLPLAAGLLFAIAVIDR